MKYPSDAEAALSDYVEQTVIKYKNDYSVIIVGPKKAHIYHQSIWIDLINPNDIPRVMKAFGVKK